MNESAIGKNIRGEYSRGGRFGVGTPQANSTVEDEFSILMPRDVSFHAVRLTSAAGKPEDRLCEYMVRLGEYLLRYDVMPLDGFAFACTASSYLLGADAEQSILTAIDSNFPIYTATGAINWALHRINAKRILIVAPYPEFICEAASRYWRSAGYDVVDIKHIQTETIDTRSIYDLGSLNVKAALEAVSFDGIDAVVVSGTGMPSLPVIACDWAVPILSSNLCLAAQLLASVNSSAISDAGSLAINGWQKRLAEVMDN